MLAIDVVRSDADLENMIRVQALVRPDWRPKLENLRHNLDSNPDLTYLVGRLGDEPVACGFVEPWGSFAQGDLAVVPARRRSGIGTALFAEISARARKLGNDELQGEVQETDTESIAFFEQRGFARVGGEKAVVLELEGLDPPEVDPPAGVRIVTRAEEPDRLEGMYAIANQADEDIPGSAGVQSFERWRAWDIDRPNCLPELCFLALAGDEVIGYAFLQTQYERAFHGLTATRRDWRRKGVASALKRAEIAAAKRAGLERLLTESEERNEPMRRLNEKLGFVPAPEWSTVVLRGPLAILGE
ncbi:MAG TPA: GNAT family N-acetyltransferase [Gaiellaceae bacterium]